MKIQIEPSRLQGTLSVPASKSIAHRMLICAGLAEGVSVVERVSFSKDIEATIMPWRRWVLPSRSQAVPLQ